MRCAADGEIAYPQHCWLRPALWFMRANQAMRPRHEVRRGNDWRARTSGDRKDNAKTKMANKKQPNPIDIHVGSRVGFAA